MERKGNLRDFSKNIIFRFDYLFYIGNKGERKLKNNPKFPAVEIRRVMLLAKTNIRGKE